MRTRSTLLAIGLVTALASGGCGKIATNDIDGGAADAPGDITVVSLSVTPGGQQIRIGETLQLSAVATRSDGSTEDVTDRATWESPDEGTATVDAGLVTGVTAGDVTITAIFQSQSGSADLTVRGGLGSTADNPGQSCRQILDAGESLGNGVYWINPTGTSSFQVYCDMTTAGGGWMYTYWDDAEHFDGIYLNNTVVNDQAPTFINQWADTWNAESVFGVTETLFGCTTQDNAAAYYWTYDAQPQSWFASAAEVNDYYNNLPSVGSNTTAGGCVAGLKTVASYGFAVIESGAACGTCMNMLWGMYHYQLNQGSGCNSTSNLYPDHPSPWDGRPITYPICNGTQTSNGQFWIAVR